MLNSLRGLRPQSLRRFAAVGLVSAVFDFTAFNLVLLAIGPSKTNIILANTAAFCVATSVSFVLNSRFTFDAARTRATFMRYLSVAVIAVGIYNLTLLLLLTRIDPGDRLLTNIAKAIAVAPSATWNFLGFALFAFNDRRSAPATEMHPTASRAR